LRGVLTIVLTIDYHTTRMSATNCTLLASMLSASYRSTLPFAGDSTRSLQEYLQSNGVLFTMCLDISGQLNCSLLQSAPPPPPPHHGPHLHKPVTAHWSGSWANARTSFRPFPGVNVGQIADAGALNLTCLYPSDGSTDYRDNLGCGPFRVDPKYGSQGYDVVGPLTKRLLSLEVREELGSKYPAVPNISCFDLFNSSVGVPVPPGVTPANVSGWHADGDETDPSACAAMKAGQRGIVTSSFYNVATSAMEPYYGGPICTLENPSPSLDGQSHSPIYNGSCSFSPHEFQAAMDLMATPSAFRSWIVTGLAHSLKRARSRPGATLVAAHAIAPPRAHFVSLVTHTVSTERAAPPNMLTC